MSDVPESPAAITTFVAAINEAGAEAFVGVLEVDGFVNGWGAECRGRDRARRWAGSDAIGAGVRMNVRSATTEGSATRIRLDWRSRLFNGESTGIFVRDGGTNPQFRDPARELIPVPSRHLPSSC